jgi:hypothetical protein
MAKKIAPVQNRPLYEIAADIRKNYPTLYFGAVPYVDTLAKLDKITDMYHADSAETIVRYLQGNLMYWRGEHAKRIKAELKALLGEK